MFIQTGHLYLTYIFPIIEVVGWGAGFPIQESQVQNRWVVPRSTQPFILPGSIKWVPGTPQDWVVKSKLPPCSGSVPLRTLNPLHKKGP